LQIANTLPRQQIDDTVNVMKKNLESVAQRGEHIDQLQDKSENLNQSAQGFRRGANRVRKQMWWKNMKMRIWIIVGIIVLLLLIIIPSGELDLSSIARKTRRLITCVQWWQRRRIISGPMVERAC